MITFPNAKINLGLNIVEKRPDGYHNLETIFYPINLQDALEVNRMENSQEPYKLHISGTPIEGAPEENLVVKAYNLLREKYELAPVDIHLYKHIPMGAGLGGGSADCAFMIKVLNEKCQPTVPSSSRTSQSLPQVSGTCSNASVCHWPITSWCW